MFSFGVVVCLDPPALSDEEDISNEQDLPNQ